MSSDFAFAIPSAPPTNSPCASPTLVTTPISGNAMSHRRLISPKPRIPISNVSASHSSGAFKMVTGTPMSLFNDLSAEKELGNPAFNTAATKFFVDVFPAEPVMPTTRALCASNFLRNAFPTAANADTVSATSTHGKLGMARPS